MGILEKIIERNKNNNNSIDIIYWLITKGSNYIITKEGIMEGSIDCSVCGHLACVCPIKKAHTEDCKFRIASTCAVGIECNHGYDVCKICDPCTCTTGEWIGYGPEYPELLMKK